MNQVSPETLREIYDECGGDLDCIASKLNISPSDLPLRLSPGIIPTARRRKPPADVGKSYFRKHIVSVRHAEHPSWPLEDLGKIEDARAKYEAGTHEICQGRSHKDWFVLYCVPRQVRVGARKFFRTEF